MAKESIRNLGTIVPLGTMEFIKIVLKKSHFGCLRASFGFINTQKPADFCALRSAKGHQMRDRKFYFESCVCQKKEQKSNVPVVGFV